MNLVPRKLRIKFFFFKKKRLVIVTLEFWGHAEGKMYEFESHVLSHLEYSVVSEKPVI